MAGRLKRELVDLFHAHGAVHLQSARTYRYRDSLAPAAHALLRRPSGGSTLPGG